MAGFKSIIYDYNVKASLAKKELVPDVKVPE
jgi:hypothetical protein